MTLMVMVISDIHGFCHNWGDDRHDDGHDNDADSDNVNTERIVDYCGEIGDGNFKDRSDENNTHTFIYYTVYGNAEGDDSNSAGDCSNLYIMGAAADDDGDYGHQTLG